MSTFDTPEPISATIDLSIGNVHISTSDGGATTVDVLPSDVSDDEDCKAAERDPHRVLGRAAADQIAQAPLVAQPTRAAPST